jgi:hypothetical protein
MGSQQQQQSRDFGKSLMDQYKAMYEAQQATPRPDVVQGYKDRYQSGVDSWNKSVQGYNDRYKAGAGDAEATTQGFRDRYQSGVSDMAGTIQGYNDRYNRGMKNLEGMGLQEAADIRDSWTSANNSARQSLSARGLGGTSVVSTMQQGMNKNQNADLGRLNERVRAQKLATDANLSGDALSAQERASALKANLSGDVLSSQERASALKANLSGDSLSAQERSSAAMAGLSGDVLSAQERTANANRADLSNYNQNMIGLSERLGQNQLSFQNQYNQGLLNFQERRTDEYPDFGQYAQLAIGLGRAGYTPPSGTGAGSTITTGTTTGTGTTGGGITGGGVTGGGPTTTPAPTQQPRRGFTVPAGYVQEQVQAGTGTFESGGLRTIRRPLTENEIRLYQSSGWVLPNGFVRTQAPSAPAQSVPQAPGYSGFMAGQGGGYPPAGTILGVSVGAPTGAGAATQANLYNNNSSRIGVSRHSRR